MENFHNCSRIKKKKKSEVQAPEGAVSPWRWSPIRLSIMIDQQV